MQDSEKNKIIKRYEDRVKRYGPSIEALATGGSIKQAERYELLSSISNLNNSKILDLGCGLGDFYKWLLSKKINHIEYTGYDITPSFIKEATIKYPDANFEVRDIEKDGIPYGKYDYIFSSQVFNNKFEEDSNLKVMKKIMSILYKNCNKGIAMDMMSQCVDFTEPHLYYYNPIEIFSHAMSLTKNIKIFHNFPNFQMTIFLYKQK